MVAAVTQKSKVAETHRQCQEIFLANPVLALKASTVLMAAMENPSILRHQTDEMLVVIAAMAMLELGSTVMK